MNKVPVIKAMEIKEDRGYKVLRLVIDPPFDIAGTTLHGLTFALKGPGPPDAIPVDVFARLFKLNIGQMAINIGGHDGDVDRANSD